MIISTLWTTNKIQGKEKPEYFKIGCLEIFSRT